MRVLVTGVAGFAGPVVARALGEAGHEVHGLVRGAASPRLADVPFAALHRADVTDAGAVARVVADVAPDGVVHLAAWAHPAGADADPGGAYRTNLGGTLALLAAMRAHAPSARLVAVSSGAVYGDVRRAELPIVETTPLRPLGAYGASKAAAEIAALQWSRAHGLDVVAARPFNHIGPGQSPKYVCAALASQVAAIESGRQPAELLVGNMDVVRDFSDVRDVAAGYVALLERGRRGEAYNLCSGIGASVAEIIAELRTLARVPLRVRIDPARRRAADVERLVGSAALASAHTGWCPKITLRDALARVLDDWRGRLPA